MLMPRTLARARDPDPAPFTIVFVASRATVVRVLPNPRAIGQPSAEDVPKVVPVKSRPWITGAENVPPEMELWTSPPVREIRRAASSQRRSRSSNSASAAARRCSTTLNARAAAASPGSRASLASSASPDPSGADPPGADPSGADPSGPTAPPRRNGRRTNSPSPVHAWRPSSPPAPPARAVSNPIDTGSMRDIPRPVPSFWPLHCAGRARRLQERHEAPRWPGMSGCRIRHAVSGVEPGDR
ncbi:hypothetical protein GPN2_21016 [Streptomyces murinus]